MGLFSERHDMMAMLLDRGDEKRMRAQSAVFNVQSDIDLPYLNDEGKAILMDLYRPTEYEGTLPVIFDVHGGGWYRGNKENNRNYGSYLAAEGYATLCINYTLSQYNDLSRQVRDVLCAVRWLRDNADAFDLDLSRLYVSGDSAGAHLALLSYFVDHSDALRSVYDVEPIGLSVKAFGLVCPVTDLHFLTDGAILPQQRKIAESLFGRECKKSPLYYCSSVADVLRTGMHLPPVYFVSSEEDIFKSQSIKLHHVLTRRNVDNQFRFLPKGKHYPLQHSFPVLYPEYEESIAVNQEMLRFFRSHT